MKIYNKKYLIIGILVSLVTACGSGSSSNSEDSSAPLISSLPNTSKLPIDKEKPVVKPTVKPEKVEVIQPKLDNNKIETYDKIESDDELVVHPSNLPVTENRDALDTKQDRSLEALNGMTAFNQVTSIINVTNGSTNAISSSGKGSQGVNKGTINGIQSDSTIKMTIMEGSYGGSLENSGVIEGTGANIIAMYNILNSDEGSTSINNGDIKLNNTKADLKQRARLISLVGMRANKFSTEHDSSNGNITLINNKNITVKDSVNPENLLHLDIDVFVNIGGMEVNYYNTNPTIENKMVNNGAIIATGMQSFGMKAEGNNIDMINKGTIKTNGRFSRGMIGFGKGVKAINEGTINIQGASSKGIDVQDTAIGINERNGIISGIQLDYGRRMILMQGSKGSSLKNSGVIEGTGANIIGMNSRSYNGEGFTSVNDGDIKLNNIDKDVKGLYLVGIETDIFFAGHNVNKDTTVINNKNITVKDLTNSNFSDVFTNIGGMKINNSSDSTAENKMINNGIITITGLESFGMKADGKNIDMVNKGTIKVDGKSSYGMAGFGKNVKIVNEGIIDITGNNVNGIYVLDGATGINEVNGVIDINGENAVGMSASNGSKIINKGKIILKENAIGMYAGNSEEEEDNAHSSIVNEGEIIFKDGNVSKLAIKATGNSSYVNKGKIIDDTGMEIKIEDKAKFIVGKEASGDVAVVRSKRSLKIDGNVVASKDLIDGNKKEIVYNDVFSAPKVELVRATDPKAVSLFYNSKLALNNNGNADMLVYRNKTTVERSYENKEFKSLTNSLDRYLNIEGMKLSEDEKLVVNKLLKVDNINDVKKIVKSLSGEIHANLPRQIFDIQDRFVKEDMKLIDNLDEYDYNFNFFGDKTSVKNKGEISGYKSTSGGFVGTKKFQDNLYATIGYENSNIKYSEGSKGSIQSIHTGFYKKLSLNEFNIDLGLNGEYNFHETNREIDSFNVKAKGKYNSYSLGANTEISRVYGESLYFKPSAGLSLGYGQYEKFTEKNAGDLGLMVKDESYFSVLPKIGFKVGKNFEFVDIYSNIIYSYELGDLNKKQGMSLLGDKVHYTLNSDSLEKVNLAANLGVSTEIKDFKLTLEIGKEFGKRENNYLSLGVGYKF